MKLTIEHLAPYLPYGLKVQYEGIINGKEISEYKKQWGKDHPDTPILEDMGNYSEPNIVRGPKIGLLKEIHANLKHTKYRIGNNGRQSHYNTNNFKPILRPLSDLTKEIEHNGVKILPSDELSDSELSYIKEGLQDITRILKYDTVQTLLSWHFDIFGLIDQGLAIDINQLKK